MEEEVQGKVILDKGEVTPEQMEEIEQGEFLTVSEVADKFRYSYQWVLWMLQEGRIKGIKPLGGRWRIPRSEYERILKGGIAPMPREQAAKPPVTTINVDEKVVAEKIKETEVKKQPPPMWPIDFSSLFSGKK